VVDDEIEGAQEREKKKKKPPAEIRDRRNCAELPLQLSLHEGAIRHPNAHRPEKKRKSSFSPGGRGGEPKKDLLAKRGRMVFTSFAPLRAPRELKTKGK